MSAGTAALSKGVAGFRRRRVIGMLSVLVVAAMAMVVGPSQPAAAQVAGYPQAPSTGQCTLQQWQHSPLQCAQQLGGVAKDRAQCLNAPTPQPPDAGLAGWFVSQPSSAQQSGVTGMYSQYGYAGYSFALYDQGCATAITQSSDSFQDTVANFEFMVATAIIGASNALREKAWDPHSMWGWADSLVKNATQSIYKNVFTVFGSITLCIVGLYLLWRARQADMSHMLTTAGWAILVMVVITALAAWPVRAAHLADGGLTTGLSAVHGAVTTDASTPPDQCPLPDPDACIDHRTPAVAASDTVTENILYNNWLRGELGSATSATALKYGPALYDAKSLSWMQYEEITKNPDTRDALIAQKNGEWMSVAEQIRKDDPQAYSYLQGNEGMDRVGAGLIAIISALFFALFDITASVLVLIGFLIFRWAVIAAPMIGTLALLRPASAGLRRLANSVVAATFNVIIFGGGAAIYLSAVTIILNTSNLPGWLQVVLILLVGVVGWLLLRPHRRLTQMAGQSHVETARDVFGWHRRFVRDVRDSAHIEREEEVVRTRGRPGAVSRVETRPEFETAPRSAGGSGRLASQVYGGESRPVREPRNAEPAFVDSGVATGDGGAGASRSSGAGRDGRAGGDGGASSDGRARGRTRGTGTGAMEEPTSGAARRADGSSQSGPEWQRFDGPERYPHVIYRPGAQAGDGSRESSPRRPIRRSESADSEPEIAGAG
jgi:hypothetical protein